MCLAQGHNEVMLVKLKPALYFSFSCAVEISFSVQHENVNNFVAKCWYLSQLKLSKHTSSAPDSI